MADTSEMTGREDERTARGVDTPDRKADASPRKGDRDDAGRDGEKRDRKDHAKDDGDKQGGKDKDEDEDEPPKKRSKLPLIIGAIVVILVVIAGVFYYLSRRNLESTDDAYTEGVAVATAAKVSGYVTQLNVNDNVFVKTGDLLLKIDPRDQVTARDQARANLSLAEAQMASAQTQLDIVRVQAPANLATAQAQLAQARATQANAARENQRQRSVDPRATTQTSVDQASTTLQSAQASIQQAQAQVQVASLVDDNIRAADQAVRQRQAQVDQAKASLAAADVNLSYTELRAPQDGWVTRRNVELGTYVQAGQQMFYIVSPNIWVIANFKETQLDRMRPGQQVDIDVDAYPDLKLHGHIDTVQQGSGGRFTAFPAENATGNFVKIVRRVPVKIVIDRGLENRPPLPLGLSVEPTVSLR